MKQLKLSNVIEKVKRILEPESNSSEQNKAGGGYLPGIIELELEAEEERITRSMSLVDEKTNGKYKVQFFRKDGTLIIQAERQNCSDEEFYTLLHEIQNMM